MTKKKNNKWKATIKTIVLGVSFTIAGWAAFDFIRTSMNNTMASVIGTDPLIANVLIFSGAIAVIVIIGRKSISSTLQKIFN